HQVASYARPGDGAFGNPRRGVVRAAGAEIGYPPGHIPSGGEHALELAQARDMPGNLFGGSYDAQDPLADRDRDFVGVQRSFHRKQDLALFVLLPDDDRMVGRAVEIFTKLDFKERSLLLDDD